MKTLEDCLETLEEQKYVFTETLLEFIDADVVEGLLKSIYNSESTTDRDLLVFAKSLRIELRTEMFNRALEMQNKPNPLDVHFDEVDAGLNRLNIKNNGDAK